MENEYTLGTDPVCTWNQLSPKVNTFELEELTRPMPIIASSNKKTISMDKKQRLEIIKKVAQYYPKSSIIDSFIIDELKYAGKKALQNNLNLEEEYNKVLETYTFDGYVPSEKVNAYVKHYILNPTIAGMQHTELKRFVSYIGEYYDGTVTG